MSTLISCAIGNWLDAATWAIVDPTSLLDAETAGFEIATAAAWSSSAAFVPGAIEIDGIAIKMYSKGAGNAGTVSVRLYDVTGGAAVAGTTVTINTSDLPTCSAGAAKNEGGWILFKFGAPVILLGGGNQYRVEAQESVAADDVYFWRNGTANNMSRMLRTTTTQAPAASDILHVMGEHTGAGAGTNFTVTMNSVAATDYGSGVDASTALTVCERGTLNYAFAAATNYYLKLSGNAIIYNGGTFTVGTAESEMPRDSTAILEFDPVADGGMGLIARNGSTVTMQGLSRTAGKNVVSCLLNTDEAIASTDLGVDTDTGWLDNDEIAVASTTRTYSQCEKGAMAAGAGAAQLTVDGFGGAGGGGGGLAYAHSGTSPTQAEVIMLTRNVKVRSATSTIMTYFSIKPTAAVDADWVEFYYLGENATDKRGIVIETTDNTSSFTYCSFHDFEDYGIYFVPSSGKIGGYFGYNVLWSCCSIIGGVVSLDTYCYNTSPLTVTHNIIMYTAYSGANGIVPNGAPLSGTRPSWTYNTVCGVRSYGFYFTEVAWGYVGTFSYNTAHSCNGNGLHIRYLYSSTIDYFTSWRNNSSGIRFYTTVIECIFDNITLFGNLIQNLDICDRCVGCLISNSLFAADTSFATSYGLYAYITSGRLIIADMVIESCSFGVVAGIYAAHTKDIYILGSAYTTITLINNILASATEVDAAGISPYNYIKSERHDQVASRYYAWFKYGIIKDDQVIFDVIPSIRAAPNNASSKLEIPVAEVALDGGQTASISIKVRESVVGDGADYNGNRIRLIVKKNIACGINADTVLATATVASEGAFETINGVTAAVTENGALEFVVDCDGTTGWINVDTCVVS